MRFAGLLFLLPFAVVAAQPAPPQATQHGVKAYSLITYLFDPPEPAASIVPYAQFETWVEQLGSDYQESILGGFGEIERGTTAVSLQRFVRDHFREVYVSYSVKVEALAEPGQYRVTFGDSGAPPPDDLKPRSEWKVVSPPLFPVPQIVRDGDEIPLELFTSAGGIKLVDYIHIGRQDKMARRTDAARDSYAEDAEFSLSQPRLRVNGVARESAVLPETTRGSVLWIYVPGRGRYVLAFNRSQDLDMQRVGEVGGSLMTLMVEGNLLRIESTERIAAGGGVYNVYGVHVPGWEPADPKDRERFMAGTSPGVELAIGR